MKTRILETLIIIFLIGTILLCIRNFQLKRELNLAAEDITSLTNSLRKIDTVIVDKPFEKEKPFATEAVPSRVTIYRTRPTYSSTSNTAIDHSGFTESLPVLDKRENSNIGYLKKETLIDTHLNHLDLDYADTYDSSKDSLVQFLLCKDKLDMSFFSLSDSVYFTRTFNIDLDRYKYNYTEGVLTQKKILGIKLRPYIEGKIRPINLMFDVSGGLSLSTKHMIYKIGVDLGYYPRFEKEFQKDLELSIQYTF